MITDTSEERIAEPQMQIDTMRNFIGYALRRAQLIMFDDLVRTLESLELRPAYFSVLYVIGENPGLNQSEVSASLGIQRTNFVTMVDQLETQGLLSRQPAKNDRRSHALYLTSKGITVLERAKKLHHGHDERFVKKLGPGGREKLLPLLWKLVEE